MVGGRGRQAKTVSADHAGHAIEGGLQVLLMSPQVNEAQHSPGTSTHLRGSEHTHPSIVQHLACKSSAPTLVDFSSLIDSANIFFAA